MLSPRWRKALGDLRQHPGRTALVVLAIAIGLAGAATILNAWALVRVATTEGYLASQPAAATLRLDSLNSPDTNDSVSTVLLARVRAFPGVRDAQARRTTLARAQVAGATFTAVLYTVDEREPVRIGRVEWEQGAPPADGTLTIERSSLGFTGAAVGGDVRLSVGDGAPRAVPVGGLARDVGLAPGWMEHLLYGFVSRATLAELGASDALDEIRIVLDDPDLDQSGVRAVAFALKADLESTGHRVRDVEVPVPGEHIHAPQMDSLLYTQFAFALLALALSAFLVVNLIAAMLAGQTREIGVMKAIGARWPQLAAMYLSTAAALGVAAVAVAVPAALVAGRRYAALKAELLNFDLTGYGVPPWVIAVEVAVGILLPVVAAAFPVWHGSRIAVNDALRDVGIRDAGSQGVEGLVHRIGGLPRPLLFALRNAFRRRQRTALTLGTLAMGGAVFLGAINLRSAVLRATEAIFAAQRYDLSLRFAVPQDPSALEAVVRAVPGVEAAEAWGGARATFDHGDGTLGNAFTITAPPVGTTLLELELEEGRWLRADDTRALVVGRGMRRIEPGLRAGMTVRLLVAGAVEEWQVVGVVESGPGPTAYAGREAVAAIVGAGATTVVVKSAVEGQATQVDLILRLRRALAERGMPVATSALLAEAKRGIDDHLLMVVQFLGAMAWVMIVVGGLALASTMGLAVLERTREIGVLRAIGARHGAIHSLVQVEGLTIALLSWLVAIPLSVPMSVILGEAFGRIMLPVPTRWTPEPAGVAVWLGLVVAVSLLACLWPAVRATRVPTAAALAYE